ncbi:hypothetical protein CH063_11918 [Colletotrichum higginsianum]|uniref:Uncharacterized protein n=1 Tax=Colletotrichum higginsianum (strain IMI 349063) TaxID=759273 RepID=H1VNB5_COLHI|nr:hypothetical protein CH063_11918 [Colletotrichum higginsianum]
MWRQPRGSRPVEQQLGELGPGESPVERDVDGAQPREGVVQDDLMDAVGGDGGHSVTGLDTTTTITPQSAQDGRRALDVGVEFRIRPSAVGREVDAGQAGRP